LILQENDFFLALNYYALGLIRNKHHRDISHIEIHRAEPLVSEVSPSEFEIAYKIEKQFKAVGFSRIPIELIQAGVETVCLEIPGFVNSIWN
jgi:hypothetical protein